jgi:hypothetical protein
VSRDADPTFRVPADPSPRPEDRSIADQPPASCVGHGRGMLPLSLRCCPESGAHLRWQNRATRQRFLRKVLAATAHHLGAGHTIQRTCEKTSRLPPSAPVLALAAAARARVREPGRVRSDPGRDCHTPSRARAHRGAGRRYRVPRVIRRHLPEPLAGLRRSIALFCAARAHRKPGGRRQGCGVCGWLRPHCLGLPPGVQCRSRPGESIRECRASAVGYVGCEGANETDKPGRRVRVASA